MKVVAINGSPHENGNTAQAIGLAADELKTRGIETEVLTVGTERFRGCIGCGSCRRSRDCTCVFTDDSTNEFIKKMMEADGIILAAPTHFAGVGGYMKGFLDRAFYVSMSNGGIFRHKVGAALATVRRSGGMTTLDQLNKYLLYSEMMVASSNYWNVIHGAVPGEVSQDAEGSQIIRLLGKNMAWMLELRARGLDSAPAAEKKVFTNFIR